MNELYCSLVSEPTKKPPIIHDGRDCCAKAGVSKECLGLCRLIASSPSGQAQLMACAKDVAKIDRCIWGGKTVLWFVILHSILLHPTNGMYYPKEMYSTYFTFYF